MNPSNGSLNINQTAPTGSTIGGSSDNDRDPNCREYINGRCATCSARYYSGIDLKCLPVNPLCSSYNSVGACTACYTGFSLRNDICAISRDTDLFCMTRNIVGACIQCFSGFFINSTRCTGLNPLCQTSNLTNGQCTACFRGYALNAGLCIVSSRDPNCR